MKAAFQCPNFDSFYDSEPCPEVALSPVCRKAPNYTGYWFKSERRAVNSHCTPSLPARFLESAIGMRQGSLDLGDYGRTEGEFVVMQIDLDFSIVADLALDHSFGDRVFNMLLKRTF